jgi:hypothetical protein
LPVSASLMPTPSACTLILSHTGMIGRQSGLEYFSASLKTMNSGYWRTRSACARVLLRVGAPPSHGDGHVLRLAGEPLQQQEAGLGVRAFFGIMSPRPPLCEARFARGCSAQLTWPTTLLRAGSLTTPANEVESRYIAA